MNRNWYKGGKHNECEKYQLKMIEKIISNRVEKTYFRINIETNELTEIAYPLKKIDGFEWTKNFDGRLLINKNTYLFNLKFVCDRGGTQTRSLREVYHFIKAQISYINKNRSTNTYFINILDGDTCFSSMDKYLFLINRHPDIKKYIFIGSLHDFQKYKYEIFNN